MIAVVWLSSPAVGQAAERLCDASFENCRTALIELIRQEQVGIDVAFWFMEDSRYTTELIGRWRAGVPVRVLIDTDANSAYPTNVTRVQELKDAGIPIRNRSSGILHWKMMLFAGQDVVQFSGANYSPNAFVPNDPYKDYVDEVIYFTDDADIVNSFRTKYDDNWTSTSGWSDYANIVAPLTRSYPIYPIHPDLNFHPTEDFAKRSVKHYDLETAQIDSIMYRITDRKHADALINARARGIPVRLYTEPKQYRDPNRLWHAWNVDRLYMAGVHIRHRKHLGLNHEKLTLLHGQGLAVFGSANWTASSTQLEHNYFTTKPWFFQWALDHFERKWNNSAGYAETQAFTPLPPDAPVNVFPASGATNLPLQVELRWYAGPWAHKYDIYFGDTPDPPLVASDVMLGPSETKTQYIRWTVPVTLAMDRTYYWKTVSKTMANLSKTGAVTSFRTIGPPPTAGGRDVVLYAWKAPVRVGNWAPVTDATAAGGTRMANPNLGASKLSSPLADPQHYFEMSFFAEAGVAYRLWLRGKAEKNSYNNDSVYVQFSDSVTSGGDPVFRIGTTSGTNVTIEDCSGCGLSGWGWNDNGYGAGVLGTPIYFHASGVHTIRVQVREDGLSVDQIVLSRDEFISSAPGVTKDDAMVYVESGGADGTEVAIQDDNGTEIVMHTAHAMQVRGKWNVVADSNAASGYRLWNPNAGASRPSAPLAAPADYFEVAFYAKAGVPYHLWLRGRAESNSTSNDSVYVQFTGSLNADGLAAYRIGTTDGFAVTLQDGTGASLSGFGWNDNGYDVPGVEVWFQTEGWQTVRLQRREDGISIDQIVLSSAKYLTTAPGAARDDSTILATSSPRHR